MPETGSAPADQPVRLRHPELQRMYDDARRRLDAIKLQIEQDAASPTPRFTPEERAAFLRDYPTMRAGLAKQFTGLDNSIAALPEANRAAALRALSDFYNAITARVDAPATTAGSPEDARRAGAGAADRLVAAIQEFFGGTARVISGQSTTAPPAPPSPTTADAPSGLDQFLSRFQNLTWGNGIGALLGAGAGWLLGSLFGPGSWLSTIVSVLFAAGGAFIGGTQWGPTINRWITGQSGPSRPRRPGEPASAPGAEPQAGERYMTRDEARGLYDAYQQYRAQNSTPPAVQPDDEDSRHSAPHRHRENRVGYAFRPQ